MVDAAGELGLELEAGAHVLGGGDVPKQGLHRDLAARIEVKRAVHPPHRALAEQTLDLVFAVEDAAEVGVGLRLVELGPIARTVSSAGPEDRAAAGAHVKVGPPRRRGRPDPGGLFLDGESGARHGHSLSKPGAKHGFIRNRDYPCHPCLTPLRD